MNDAIRTTYLRLLKRASASWFFSLVLSPLVIGSALFLCAVTVRRWVLSVRSKRRTLLSPIVSIGNITVGGTGKTPFVMLLMQHIHGHLGLVTRGYRRRVKGLCVAQGPSCTPDRCGDEAVLVARRFPSCTIAVGDSKWQAAKAVDGHCDLLFLDDGLQRYDIPVCCSIATIDCACPDGYGWLLPRGLLREPFSWIGRADYFVITNPNDSLPRQLDVLQRFSRPIIVTAPKIERLFAPDGTTRRVDPSQPVALFSGIAAPERFRRSMEGEGYHVVDHLIVPDHSPIDEALLCDWSRSVRLRFPEAVVVGTEKDWARREQWLSDVAFCEMKLAVIHGQEVFDEVCHRIRHCISARS